MVKEVVARERRQENTTHILLASISKHQARRFGRMEHFVVYTNQSIPYSSIGTFPGSAAGIGRGSDQYLVLYYWLIPDYNA